MAKNLVINGITYNGVGSLSIPTSNGGSAEYKDASNFENWVFEMESGTTVEKAVFVE